MLAGYASGCRQNGIRMVLAVIPSRQDTTLAEYTLLQQELQSSGVESVDLSGVFAPGSAIQQLWCLTDTHPTPAAMAATAHEVALFLTEGSLPEPEERKFTLQEIEKKVCTGNSGGSETLYFRAVAGNVTAEAATIWVAGDSNALIYHDGIGIAVKKSGFADHLAYYLDTEVFLLGMRGNCTDQLRGEIYRRCLQGKENDIAQLQTIVFVLSFEQFTKGANRWQVIPAPGSNRSCAVRKN